MHVAGITLHSRRRRPRPAVLAVARTVDVNATVTILVINRGSAGDDASDLAAQMRGNDAAVVRVP